MEKYITDYKLANNGLDIEKMIKDFKNYVWTIIENNSKNTLSTEDKEEILADVFLSVWHSKGKIQEDRPLNNYIAGITKNLIKNKLRQNIVATVEITEEEQIDLDSIELIYEQNEVNRAIKEELNNMNKQDYEIFCKYYYFSKTIKEIAKELNLSENNVKVKLHRIRKKLKNNLYKRGIYLKVLSIILVIFAVTGVVFAKEIIQFVKNMFINTSDGVDTAIENGYIQEIDMEYEKNNGVGVKVDYVLMDDFHLNIMFNIDLPEMDNLSLVQFDDLVITDEENNLLLTEFKNRDNYLQFCKKNGIENTNNYMAIGNYNSSYLEYDYQNSNYVCSYIIRSDEFPKSKKLNISFDKIILYARRGIGGEILDTISGNWEINIDIDEKMYNRETLVYDLIYCNDENLELISASVSETGMKIKCKTIWREPVYSKEDSEEEKEKKKQDFYDRPFSIDDVLIQNEYVMNENGKVFYPSESSDDDGGYGQLLDGTLTHWQTFNLTTLDATDTLTIVFSKGGEWKDENDEEVIIKLTKNKMQ